MTHWRIRIDKHKTSFCQSLIANCFQGIFKKWQIKTDLLLNWKILKNQKELIFNSLTQKWTFCFRAIPLCRRLKLFQRRIFQVCKVTCPRMRLWSRIKAVQLPEEELRTLRLQHNQVSIWCEALQQMGWTKIKLWWVREFF